MPVHTQTSLRKRALAVLALATLAVALIVGASSAAQDHPGKSHKPHKSHKHHSSKPPSSFFGVVPQGPLSDADYEKMAQSGVKVLRTGLYWTQVQPTEGGGYDWSRFDSIVRGAAEHGITVLPNLYGTPDWVSKGLDGNNCTTKCPIYAPRSTAALAAWKSFARAAAARYGPGGDFWTNPLDILNPIPKKYVYTWQVWNEQNSKTFYLPKPDPKKYEKVLSAAASGLRSEEPKADIVLGGMFGLPGKNDESHSIAAADFLKSLLKIKGAKREFDGFALHPYSGGLNFIVKQVEASIKQMKKSGYPSAELWITETGAASGGKPSALNLGSQKAQAQRVTDTYKLFERHRREWNVKLVSWFAWQDSHASDDICFFCAKAGLVTESGKPKLALSAYKRAAK